MKSDTQQLGRVLQGDDTLLCTLDRLFDRGSEFMIKGASFRGAELEVFSVEAAPVALKVKG